MNQQPTPSRGRARQRGGPWTEKKLQVVAKYLRAYCIALKKKRFRTVYIDAFAGAGTEYLNERSPQPLFSDFVEEEPQDLLRGSARRALACDPPFDRYVFIEKDSKRHDELKSLLRRAPASEIDLLRGDANELVPRECQRDWHRENARGVIFLDPYGMQVEWSTIESIASTRALDLWVLFPLGVAINRLVVRSGLPDIPEPWQGRLDGVFGTRDWRDHFYRAVSRPTLFGSTEVLRRVPRDAIGAYFIKRLRTVFEGGVVNEPGVLRNSRGVPLYLLCFAVANPAPRARGLALKIANDLLKGLA